MIQGLLKKYAPPLEEKENQSVQDIEAEDTGNAPVFENSPVQLDGWKDSASVSRLSIYLKRHRDQGMKLVLRNGCPALHFEPGLTPKDGERWKIAKDALLLLGDAIRDLKELLRRNLIQLEEKK